MTRAEFLRLMVLNEICDDFENVDQIILPNVAASAGKLRLLVERADILESLRGLVGDGLVRAYDLSNCRDPFSGELDGMPSLEVVEEHFRTYFYATEKGKDLQNSDNSWWPFDEDGSVRSDWKIAEE